MKPAVRLNFRAEKYTLETAAAQEFMLRRKARPARDSRVIVTEGQIRDPKLQIFADRRPAARFRNDLLWKIYFGVTAFSAGAMIGAGARASVTVSTGAGCIQLRILCKNGFTDASPSVTRSALRSKSSYR